MKCLLVTTHYKPLIGGALTVYDALAKHADGDVEVLTANLDYINGSEVEGWAAFDDACSYKIHRMKALRPVRDIEPSLRNRVLGKVTSWQLKREVLSETLKLIDEGDFDTLCIGALDALGWLAEAVKIQRPVKVSIIVHGEEISQTAYSERANERRRASLHSADLIFAVSSFTADLIHSKYKVPKDRIKLQSNGVELTEYDGRDTNSERTSMGLPAGKFIFSCGWLIARKGFDNLIEAWPKVLEKYPELTLVIGGDGELRPQLEKRVKELKIENSVYFMGWVPEGGLPACYGSAELFVMANRTMPDGDTEGFGLVFLEAAAMGTVSIGGNAGGVVDAIKHGETGLLIDAEQRDEISSAILELLSDDEKRVEMAGKAQGFARTQNWRIKSSGFVQALSNLHKVP